MTLELLHHAPTQETRPTPLLFVHGAWHGAWCWDDHFLPFFAARGYHAYALSLRGHAGSPAGKPFFLTGVGDYAADVRQVIAQIERATGAAPALVGHSMGGYVLQVLLETHRAPAAVLLASIPAHGTVQFILRALRRDPLRLIGGLLTLTLRPLLARTEDVRHWLFTPDTPAAVVEATARRVGDEAVWLSNQALVLRLPRPARVRAMGTPLLVLGAERDAIFAPAEQHATARVYGTTAEIFPRMGHNMMSDTGWEGAAARIAAWLEANKV